MTRRSLLLPLAVVCVLAAAMPLHGEYPQPSPYPISWELSFDHSLPKRVVVQIPGAANPDAYWYVTYHVVNNTDRDKILYYPKFDMLTDDGVSVRSDFNIPPAVFEAIKTREHNKYLLDSNKIGGEIRQGDDQAQDGVAIWPETQRRMGTFEIFATGFWGETVIVKEGDKNVTLHKTLQLTYHMNGEDATNTDAIKEMDSQFIMR